LIQLNTGLSTLTGSINDFNSGLDKTRDGSKLLAQGATQLPALNNGITQLDQGAKQLNTGINQYITGVNSMMTTLSSAPSYGNVVSELKAEYTSELPYYDYMTNAQKAQITQLGSLVALLSGDPTAVAANNQNQQSLINGAAAISGGADSLYAQEGNITALHDGILSLDSALGLLQDGSAKIYTGAQQLQSGAADAKAGSAQLADGSSQLNNGLSQLQSGASQLSNGIKSAQSGVSSSVNDANSQIAALNGLDSYVANPVDIKETNIDPVPNYGTAFAPYFLSLSLWVGALIMFVGIFLDPNEKIKVLSRHSQRRFTRIGVFALLGITQAFALGLVVQFALHIKIDNIFAYYLSACLISMAFISIVEFCIVNLDDVGKFLAMAFLVIQLTSCGGTFPMETVPAFFQKIYPFMPMTYSVRLFKDTISGFDGGDASHDIFVLVMIFVCFNLLNILFSITKRARVKNKQKAVEAAEANA
jgi:putative membrane protein